MIGRALIGALVVVLLAPGCENTQTCGSGTVFASASPSGGDGFVPTDSSVWLRLDTDEPLSCFTRSVTLINLDDGAEDLVESTQINGPGRALVRFEPAAELAADADYEIAWSVEQRAGMTNFPSPGDQGIVSFHTASGPAIDAPLTPRPIGWKAEVDGPLLGVTPEEATDYDDWLELWTSSGRFLLVTTGPADEGLPEAVWRLGEFGHIWSDAELPPGQRLKLRFAALALNGALSEWSDPATLPVPWPDSSGQGGFEEDQ